MFAKYNEQAGCKEFYLTKGEPEFFFAGHF